MTMKRIRLLVLIVGNMLGAACATIAIAQQPANITLQASLASKATTLLSSKCIKCHGGGKKEAGVDLTTRSLAISTKAMQPDNSSSSRLVNQVLKGTMPPDGALTPAEKKLLLEWVNSGGNYSKEPLDVMKPFKKAPWSFTPIKHPLLPTSKFDILSSNPLDKFIFARLQKSGLKPSLLSGRKELLRRVTIDLTGLPPTVQEINNFVGDHSPNAYEKVVDRLLANQAYGESWGRHWLDVVRYGESNGYEQNHLRANAWPYRDYVIRAFNSDKPYDEFIKEQISGDIIAKGDPDREVATGFLVAGIHDTVGISTEEGTRQQRANDLDDIAATTGVTFLGLSVNCARCHDHKFDPILTRDYYRLNSVFSGVFHGERSFDPLSTNSAKSAQIKTLREKLNTIEQERQGLLTAGKASISAANHGLNEPISSAHNEDKFAPALAKFIRFTITATNNGSEPCIDEIEVYGPKANGLNLALDKRGSKATASSALAGYAIHQVKHLNDGLTGNSHSWISAEAGKGWVQIELPTAMRVSRVVWSRDADGGFQDRTPKTYSIEVSTDGTSWTYVSDSVNRTTDLTLFSPTKIAAALSVVQSNRLGELNSLSGGLLTQLAALNPVARAYSGRFEALRPIFILPRGDVMSPGEQVISGALTTIPGLPGDFETAAIPGGLQTIGDAAVDKLNPRLQLANWICDPRNPLTSRVIVNRLWERHFGHGIVDTPSDFGNMGQPPSHPELLDWMASDLMGHGWRLKRLQKMIVTSYAYRQSHAVNSAGQVLDGDNRLLWHMPLRRMEAEAVRDSILSVSGKLQTNDPGGPGYMLFKYSVLNVAIYEAREDQGMDTWRRGVYAIPARGIRDDLLGVFDCPDSSERAANRTSTTTALQALSMLNSKFLNEQGSYFADRVKRAVAADTDVDKQVRAAYQLAFGRMPNATEQKNASQLIKSIGLQPLCLGLFNSNEFLYY